MELQHETILILDFGSQYTQLIARRIRELGVYCEIRPCTDPAPTHISSKLKGLILSGGPDSVLEDSAPTFDENWLAIPDIPILGICYGMQLLTHLGGGEVARGTNREYGPADLEILDGDAVFFKEVPSNTPIWMSHGDHVASAPSGYTALARSSGCPIAAFENRELQRVGIQFHPEVTHTREGQQMLSNFLFQMCQCSGDWSMGSFIDEQVALLQQKLGNDRVVLGLSGGVDSSVVAALLHKAIGDQLECIFVDNGLLRKGERDSVAAEFSEYRLTVVDAETRFLDGLEGVVDPEKKRKVIGETFIRVFEEEANRLGDVRWLAQGTLYPDVIESVSFKGPSATIKSHHNVGGLPEHFDFELIEPLRELFKDEVRTLGTGLGLADHRVHRQPFPGPGLAVRILGEINKSRCDLLREADAIVTDEIVSAGLYRDIWQSFAVLLPVQTVGVMGDERTYENVCVVRAVNSRDGMTADWV
ncbi:MAG: glutamine-hydrolyzing GMP synthase, partial [Myxococcota bacterium]|nr:glutamine-hydrolyzing GMP synthase [Myxococcota bacterium]